MFKEFQILIKVQTWILAWVFIGQFFSAIDYLCGSPGPKCIASLFFYNNKQFILGKPFANEYDVVFGKLSFWVYWSDKCGNIRKHFQLLLPHTVGKSFWWRRKRNASRTNPCEIRIWNNAAFRDRYSRRWLDSSKIKNWLLLLTL